MEVIYFGGGSSLWRLGGWRGWCWVVAGVADVTGCRGHCW